MVRALQSGNLPAERTLTQPSSIPALNALASAAQKAKKFSASSF